MGYSNMTDDDILERLRKKQQEQMQQNQQMNIQQAQQPAVSGMNAQNNSQPDYSRMSDYDILQRLKEVQKQNSSDRKWQLGYASQIHTYDGNLGNNGTIPQTNYSIESKADRKQQTYMRQRQLANDLSNVTAASDKRQLVGDYLDNLSDNAKKYLQMYEEGYLKSSSGGNNEKKETGKLFTFDTSGTGSMRRAQAEGGKQMQEAKEGLQKELGLSDEDLKNLLKYQQYRTNYNQNEEKQQEIYDALHTGNKVKDTLAAGTMTAKSIVQSPIAGLSAAMTNTTKKAPGLGTDTYNPFYGSSNYAQNVQQAVQNRISEDGSTAGKIGAKAYGIGYSIAESAYGMAAGAAVGLPALGTPGNVASLIPMGARAYASQLQEGLERGLTEKQAQGTAVVAGLAEMVTETFSLDHFWDIAKGSSRTARKLVVDWLAQAGIEGSEEIASDVINNIADRLINGDKSEYNKSVQDYIAQGMSEKDAKKQATKDVLAGIGESFLGGAISGGVMGGIATGANAYRVNSAANQMFDQNTNYREYADSIDTNSENYQNKSAAQSAQKAKDIADTLAKKQESGEKISSKEKRDLYWNMLDAMQTETEARAENENNPQTNQNEGTAQLQGVEAAPADDTALPQQENKEEQKELTQLQEVEAAPAEDTALQQEENRQTPEQFKTKPIDTQQIYADMDAAKTPAELAKVYQTAMDSGDQEQQKYAQIYWNTYSSKMRTEGVTKEQLDAALNTPFTQQRAYDAGYIDEKIDKSALPEELQIAYNEGRKAALIDREHTQQNQKKQMDDLTSQYPSVRMRDAFTSNYVKGMDPSSYKYAFDRAADAGRQVDIFTDDTTKINENIQKAWDTFKEKNAVLFARMNEQDVQKIFDDGIRIAMMDRQDAIAKSATEKIIGRKAEGIFADMRTEPVNDDTAKVLSGLARSFGIDVELHDTLPENNNGYFSAKEGKIVINAASNKSMVTAMHELGEFTDSFNTEEFQPLVQEGMTILKDIMGSNEYNQMRRQYEEAYAFEFAQGKKTDADLDKEIFCDQMFNIFNSENGIEKLLLRADETLGKSKARTFKEKLSDVIAKIVDAFRSLISDQKLNQYQKKVAEDGIERLQELQDRVAAAMSGAIKNYQNATLQEIAEDLPTQKRFSLNEAVEQTKDLIAVHNLDERKLLAMSDLEGMPMPSIAITKADIGHQNFGDISFLFYKDTIDPKNKKNKVYSADAWTPTVSDAHIEYKPSGAISDKVYSQLSTLADKMDPEYRKNIMQYISGDSIEYYLNQNKGEQSLIEFLADKKGFKAAFLESTGKHIDTITKTETHEKKRSTFMEAIWDKYGEDLRTKPLKEIRDSIGDLLYNRAIEQGKSPEEARKFSESYQKGAMKLMSLVNRAITYHDKPNTETVSYTDYAAMDSKINDLLDEKAYKKWLTDLFKGIEEKKGVYNQKDIFTPAGKRRTFEQLHYPYSAENIVKSMLNAGDDVKSVTGFHGVQTVRAASTDEFGSIKEIKQASGKIKSIDSEEYQTRLDELQTQLAKVINDISNETGSGDIYDHDTVGGIIQEVGNNPTPENVRRVFAANYRDISNELAGRVSDIVQAVKDMPVNMFEAKPQRVVEFSEIASAVIPNDTSQKVRSFLEERSIPIREYEHGNEQARKDAINEVPGVRFSREIDTDGNQLTQEQQAKNIDNQSSTSDPDIRYSLEVKDNGARYVDLNVEQSLFDNLTQDEQRKMAKLVIQTYFQGKYETGNEDYPVKINSRTAREFVGSRRHQNSSKEYEAKYRSAREIDNLLAASWKIDHKTFQEIQTENQNNKKVKHPEAVNGIDHYGTYFKAGNDWYTGVITILNEKSHRTFYDLTHIKSIPESTVLPFNGSPSPANASYEFSIPSYVEIDNGNLNVLSESSKYSVEQDTRKSMEILRSDEDDHVTIAALKGDPDVYFTGTDAEIAAYEKQEEAVKKNWQDIIDAPDFAAFQIDLGRGRTKILSPSVRGGLYQLSSLFNGEPVMHELFGETEGSRGENHWHSMNDLYNELVDYCRNRDIDVKVLKRKPADIDSLRKSLDIGDSDFASIEWMDYSDDTTEAMGSILEEGAELLKGEDVDNMLMRRIARKLTRKYGSLYDLNQFGENLSYVFAYAQKNGINNSKELARIVSEVAMPVIDDAISEKLPSELQQYKGLLKGYKLDLTDRQREEVMHVFGSYKAYKDAMAKLGITISAHGNAMDAMWSSLVGDLPGILEDNVTEGDMPIVLHDVLEPLSQKRVKNGYGMDNEEAATDLALEIMAEFYTEVGKKTPGERGEKLIAAGKSAAKLAEEYRKQIQREYEQKYKEELKITSTIYKQMMKNDSEKMREQKAEFVAKLKAQNKERAKKAADAYKAKEQKDKIKTDVSKLINMMQHPNKSKHIPQVMTDAVLDLIQSINFVAPKVTRLSDGTYQMRILSAGVNGKREFITINEKSYTAVMEKYEEALRAGSGSKEQRKWQDNLKNISDLYKNAKEAIKDGDISSDLQFGLNEDLGEALDQVIQNNEDLPSLNSMSSEDLEVVDKVIKNIYTAINNINQSYSMSETVSDISGEIIEHGKGLRPLKDRRSWQKAISRYLNNDSATADTFFDGLGTGGRKIYKALFNAMEEKARFEREDRAFMDKITERVSLKEIQSWISDTSPIVYENGSMKLRIGQVMSLYELSKRDSVQAHKYEGFKAGTIKINGKEHVDNVAHILTNAQIREITDKLTEDQKWVADQLQQYMATVGSERGNAMTLKMYGYEMFTDSQYFPASVDKSTVQTTAMNAVEGGNINDIVNAGFTKELKPNAHNPLILNDIFDVYLDHMNQVNTYASHAGVLQDINRINNFKSSQEFTEGGEQHGSSETVKNAINNIFGSDGEQFLVKFLKDINRREMSTQTGAGVLAMLTKNFKSASTLGNLRVVGQQPTAWFRAGVVLDAKYMMAGLAPNKAAAKMQKETSQISWIKDNGNIDGLTTQSQRAQVLGLQTKKEKINELTGWLAGKADSVTWSALYRAVYAEQADGYTGDINSEEFQKKVNDRFNEVISRTQVVDGTLFRSQMMRDTDRLNQNFSAFMAEPTKTYNMFLRQKNEMVLEYRRTGKIPKKAWEALGRIIVAHILTQLVNALPQSLADAARDEDENSTYAERFLRAYGIETDMDASALEKALTFAEGNFAQNLGVVGQLPIISTINNNYVWPWIKKEVWGESTYTSGTDINEFQALNAIDLALSGTVFKGDNSKLTTYGQIYKVANAFSMMTGIPVAATMRDTVAIYNTINDAWGGANIRKTQAGTEERLRPLHKSIKDGTDYKAAIRRAAEQGQDISTIASNLTSTYKPQYLQLLREGKKEEATQLRNRLEAVYKYLSKINGKKYTERVKKWEDDLNKPEDTGKDKEKLRMEYLQSGM